MPKQRIKTEIIEDGGSRFFTIFLYDSYDGDKIIRFLLADPLVRHQDKIDSSNYGLNKKYYMKVYFYNQKDEYYFQAKTATRFFETFKRFTESRGVKNTIDYLFKIMSPQQKVKLAYWLEGVD